MYLFLSAGTENIALNFNERSIGLGVPCFSTWETNNCTVCDFVIFQCLDVNTISVVNISIPFSNTNTFSTLIIGYLS